MGWWSVVFQTFLEQEGGHGQYGYYKKGPNMIGKIRKAIDFMRNQHLEVCNWLVVYNLSSVDWVVNKKPNTFQPLMLDKYSVQSLYNTPNFNMDLDIKWAATWDFQQCGILTSIDSDEPVQPPFKRRKSKYCFVSRLTAIEYSSDQERLWLDCAYAQAGLSLCWSHIPHC